MRIARLVRPFVPPPRRPVTVRTALPLVLFTVVFAGVCIWAEATGVLLFVSPKAFLLSVTLPWFWWMHAAGHGGLRGARSLVALLVRLTLVALFIALLADPRAVRRDDALSVVYALDASDSIGETASDAALSFIVRTVSERSDQERDAAGLVVFARDAAVELPPRPSFPFEALNARVPGDATNLAKGLSLASAMLPEERLGRIVLITDGAQTEGELSTVLDELDADGVPVDVLPIQYAYDDEVWLEKLELPRHVRAEETYEAAVVLNSLRAGAGKLRLLENGRPIYEGDVEFDAGKSRYVLPIYLREPGYYEYAAVIQAAEDGWQENNTAVNHLYLRGKGKVLLVADPHGDPRDWGRLFDALQASGFQTEVQTAYEMSNDALSLMPYDCVIFVNVPADVLDVRQMEAVRDAAYNQGTGFLMVGGANSFGPGGYHRSVIEKALPVTMDVTQKKVLPKGALVIVLHTCEFDQGNTWGKRIAKEAVKVLGDQDEVGIVAYSGGCRWIFPLTPASEYERLVPLINEAQLGDMPGFGTSMQMGLDALNANDAALKHMIIISDGDPSPPTSELLAGFVKGRISVSTVAINPHPGQDLGTMRAIPAITGGRFYFPQDPAQLPGIFIKEAKTLRRSMIQNGTFVPTFDAPSPIVKGIDELPPLHGYVLTTPKGRALTILKGPEAEQVDPVLATWRYGTGKTAAFTSDLSPNWGADWLAWERCQQFVKQLVADISRTEEQGYVQSQVFADGSDGVIQVEDYHPEDTFLELEATVTGPERRSSTVRLKQTGPRRYQGRFPLWGKGRYQVVGAAVGGGRSERFVDGLAVPYSAEYLRFRSNPIVLNEIARRTGGRVLTGQEKGDDVFVQDRKPRASSQALADVFLMLLACLVPLDVAVRRVQIDWALIRGWLGIGRGRGPSGETFQALLRRKRDIVFTDEGPRPVVKPPKGAPAGPRAPRPEEPAPEQTEEERLTTTQRLLSRKKRWREEDDSES